VDSKLTKCMMFLVLSFPAFGQGILAPIFYGQGSGVLNLSPGWTYIQDTISLNDCSGASTCTFSTPFAPTTSGTIWAVAALIGDSNVHITSVTGGRRNVELVCRKRMSRLSVGFRE